MEAYAGALLTRFYAAIDARDADAAVALMTPDVRWHVLADGAAAAASVTGREAVRDWLDEALGGYDSLVQTITAVRDEGTAAAVFTSAETLRAGERTTSAWLDSFRFEDGLISEHVSLRIG